MCLSASVSYITGALVKFQSVSWRTALLRRFVKPAPAVLVQLTTLLKLCSGYCQCCVAKLAPSLFDAYPANCTVAACLLTTPGIQRHSHRGVRLGLRLNSHVTIISNIKGMCPKIPLCVICVHSYTNIL